MGPFLDEPMTLGTKQTSAHFSLYLFHERLPFFCLGNSLLELLRHIGPYGKLNPAETFMLLVLTVLEEVMLVTGSVGT
jgi:hypothetical protein